MNVNGIDRNALRLRCRSDKDLVNQERSLAMFSNDSKSGGSRSREVSKACRQFCYIYCTTVYLQPYVSSLSAMSTENQRHSSYNRL